MASIEIGDIASSLIRAGAPVLAEVLGTVLPFPFSVVAKTALEAVAGALGVPADPAAVTAAINADPDAAAAKLSEIEAKVSADMELLKGQEQLNAKEAESHSFFIAGWRPFFAWSIIGWMNFNFVSFLTGWQPLPADLFDPAWVLFGGMMGLRTVEKWKGVATVAADVFKGKGRK